MLITPSKTTLSIGLLMLVLAHSLPAQTSDARLPKNSIGIGLNSPFLYGNNPYPYPGPIRYGFLSYSRQLDSLLLTTNLYYGRGNRLNSLEGSVLSLTGIGLEVNREVAFVPSKFAFLYGGGPFIMAYQLYNYYTGAGTNNGTVLVLGVNASLGLKYHLSNRVSVGVTLAPYVGQRSISAREKQMQAGFLKLPSLELHYKF